VRSVDFFGALGFGVEPKFTNDDAACLVAADNIFVMLLVELLFETFPKTTVCDATKSTEVLLCLSCDSRAQADDLVARAVAGGGTVPLAPQDHGFMYGQAFEDLDGHVWELIYMDPAASPATA